MASPDDALRSAGVGAQEPAPHSPSKAALRSAGAAGAAATGALLGSFAGLPGVVAGGAVGATLGAVMGDEAAGASHVGEVQVRVLEG